MQIRKANLIDVESIAHLHAASWRTAYQGALSDAYLNGPIEAERSESWRDRFEQAADNQWVVVAECLGHIVGFACAYGAHDLQWGTFIDNLHVSQEHKRQGIGAQLMREVASWSTRLYPQQGLYLWVLKSNIAARRFYERLGGVNSGSDVWNPPDGTALPKLRYAWRHAEALFAMGDVAHL